MGQLRNIATGDVYTTSVDPVWISGMWEGGDQRFTDINRNLYEVVAPPAPAWTPRLIPIGQFKIRFPFTKFVAVVAEIGADPGVTAWFNVADSLTDIDLNDPHTSAALDYFISKGYIDAADKAAALA